MRFGNREAHMLALCLLACLPQFLHSIDLFDVHKNGTVFTEGRKVYFAWNYTKHEIPNRFTFIGYGNWEPSPGTSEQKALPRGEDINSLWVPNTPCKYVRDEHGNAYGADLIVEMSRWVRGYTNAALVYRPSPHSDWIIKLAKYVANSQDGGDGHKFRGED